MDTHDFSEPIPLLVDDETNTELPFPTWKVSVFRTKSSGDLVVGTLLINPETLPPRKRKGKVVWKLPDNHDITPRFGEHERKRLWELFKLQKKERRKQLKTTKEEDTSKNNENENSEEGGSDEDDNNSNSNSNSNKNSSNNIVESKSSDDGSFEEKMAPTMEHKNDIHISSWRPELKGTTKEEHDSAKENIHEEKAPDPLVVVDEKKNDSLIANNNGANNHNNHNKPLPPPPPGFGTNGSNGRLQSSPPRTLHGPPMVTAGATTFPPPGLERQLSSSPSGPHRTSSSSSSTPPAMSTLSSSSPPPPPLLPPAPLQQYFVLPPDQPLGALSTIVANTFIACMTNLQDPNTHRSYSLVDWLLYYQQPSSSSSGTPTPTNNVYKSLLVGSATAVSVTPAERQMQWQSLIQPGCAWECHGTTLQPVGGISSTGSATTVASQALNVMTGKMRQPQTGWFSYTLTLVLQPQPSPHDRYYVIINDVLTLFSLTPPQLQPQPPQQQAPPQNQQQQQHQQQQQQPPPHQHQQ